MHVAIGSTRATAVAGRETREREGPAGRSTGGPLGCDLRRRYPTVAELVDSISAWM